MIANFQMDEKDRMTLIQASEDLKDSVERFLDLYSIFEDDEGDNRIMNDMAGAFDDFKNSLKDTFNIIQTIEQGEEL